MRVLGLTMVSGNAWEPEEVAHTLRMLELIHRTDVPVVPGGGLPPGPHRSRIETGSEDVRRVSPGTAPGEISPLIPVMQSVSWPASKFLPLKEGAPTTKPLSEDAAHFLIRQVHAHPHEVTIYAAGPLTNIALATLQSIPNLRR